MDRESAMGYCLWAMYDYDLGIKKFMELFKTISQAFENDCQYDNYSTRRLFTDCLSMYGFEEEEIAMMEAYIWRHYDEHTEYEAKRFFQFITRGRSYRERDWDWDPFRPRLTVRSEKR